MALETQSRLVWTGHQLVEVRDEDLDGLTIAVSPGVTLRGEITFTGPGASTAHPETLQ